MKKTIALVLVLLLALTALVACTPSEESLRKKYEDAGYTCISYSASQADAEEGDVNFVFAASKGLLSEHVIVICFKDSKTAGAYITDAKLEKGEYVQKGAVVAFGSEAALKVL